MSERQLSEIKEKIKRLRAYSQNYADLIWAKELEFYRLGLMMAPCKPDIKIQADEQLPLLAVKDMYDFQLGRTEAMLPAEHRPYHPQEPETDPFAHIRERFRYEHLI